MSTGLDLDHEELLTLARKVAAAAEDGEGRRAEAAARRLLVALRDHVAAERVDLARLSPHDHRRLVRGQHQVLELLDDLARAASRPARRGARPAHLARQLVARLSLQAEDERISLATTVP